jgi:hypothetical protein
MHKSTKLILLLLCMTIFAPALGWTAEVTLAWDPSSESSTIGYRLYSREEGELYDYAHPEWHGGQTRCTVSGFDEYESYYFVVRAFDSDGNESGDSNEIYWNPGAAVVGGLNGDAGGGGGGSCFIETLF